MTVNKARVNPIFDTWGQGHRHSLQPGGAAGVAPRAALRAAVEFALPRAHVTSCLRRGEDQLFRRAWRDGIDSLTLAERRGRLCVEIGWIAESLPRCCSENFGSTCSLRSSLRVSTALTCLPFTPDGEALALEVKGTLRSGTIPRFSRGADRQMSVAWLNQQTNPAMTHWRLDALDVYGAITVIDFARGTWRAALTADHEYFVPVRSVNQLLTLRLLE